MFVETVVGDLLKADVDVVVHQISSMPCKAHGLSKSIAKRFSWADHYGQRTQVGNRNLATPETQPACGTIEKSLNPGGIDGPQPKAVVGIVGQLDFGRPGYHLSRVDLSQDSPVLRLQWFQDGLTKACLWAISREFRTIGIPYLIGCGLGGGDWLKYSGIIDDVAAVFPGLQIRLFKLG